MFVPFLSIFSCVAPLPRRESYKSFCKFCEEKGRKIEDNMRYFYHFTAECDGVKYYIRCNTFIREYNFYVFAYEKK